MDQTLAATLPPPSVFVLTEDADLPRRLAPHLQRQGLPLETFAAPKEVLARIDPGSEGLLLIDHRALADREALAALLTQVAERRGRPMPLACLVPGQEIGPRLTALRAGACAYFEIAQEPALLAKRLADLIEPRRAAPDRILVVDDQPVAALFASRVLESAGMLTERVTDPLLILDVLDAFQPDLVVMDLHMPGASGIELTRIIRDQDRYADLPILFLSAELDPEQQLSALRVGGDDFLAKPVTPERLLDCVTQRLRHARERALRHADQDGLDGRTGLASLSRLIQRLNQLIGRGGEEIHRRALAVIELRGDRPAFQRLVEALAEGAASSDLAARVGERTLAVLLRRDDPGSLAEVCVELSQRLVESLPGQVIGMGWCGLSQGGGDAVTLLSRATKAARAALLRGDGRPSAYHPEPVAQVRGDSAPLIAHLTAERIRLLFEPMVAVTQTAIARYEVSPRLAMADGELLKPSRLVPLALRSGLLESLDAWILTAGLDALKVSCDAGQPVQLFLHQSFSSMRRADWVERIRDQINARDLFRRRPVLQLQIQELSEDLELASTRIQSLAHLGIRVCLNGLDPHPAALDALDTLPAAFARLARDLAQAPDPAPLSELIQRAKARGLKVIATGVDGPETIARLCRAGADLLQGPFVQPPSPVMDYDFSGMGVLDAG